MWSLGSCERLEALFKYTKIYGHKQIMPRKMKLYIPYALFQISFNAQIVHLNSEMLHAYNYTHGAQGYRPRLLQHFKCQINVQNPTKISPA